MESPGYVDIWLPALREVGALALVAIVLLHLIREYLPGLTARYLEQLKMARETFAGSLSEQREDFVRELAEQRRLFEEHNREKREAAERRHAEVIAALNQIKETHRDASK